MELLVVGAAKRVWRESLEEVDMFMPASELGERIRAEVMEGVYKAFRRYDRMLPDRRLT